MNIVCKRHEKGDVTTFFLRGFTNGGDMAKQIFSLHRLSGECDTIHIERYILADKDKEMPAHLQSVKYFKDKILYYEDFFIKLESLMAAIGLLEYIFDKLDMEVKVD